MNDKLRNLPPGQFDIPRSAALLAPALATFVLPLVPALAAPLFEASPTASGSGPETALSTDSETGAIASAQSPATRIIAMPRARPSRLALTLEPVDVVEGETYQIDVFLSEPDAAPYARAYAGTVAFPDRPHADEPQFFLVNVPRNFFLHGERAAVTIELVGINTPLTLSRVRLADARLIR
ncbi:hypothetical protein [Aurantimonas sp. VKM B-3413]|uniref:hypothetical protein n=1 Tax=Aurantimonas sp. VKM B-3413 TaxID=2779401 RepID=UPI001E4171F3|nr:hypothetical protein [Aurantimonas sp. VKM B-3413]MCB8838396.1 hypothetical protein [Aurantimonas sp. VKM B-3413]